LKINRLLALAIVYPHTKVDEYVLRNVRFRVATLGIQYNKKKHTALG